MMNKILFFLITLVIVSCSYQVSNSENEPKSISFKQSGFLQNKKSEHNHELFENFYASMAYLLRYGKMHGEGKYKQNIDSLNFYWCQILNNQSEIRSFLISSREKPDGYLYGEKFLELLSGVQLYPSKVHILYWLKILDEKDYLFGRRFKLGNNFTIKYIQNHTSIFPIFDDENSKNLPWFNYQEKYTLKEYYNLPVDFVKYEVVATDSNYIQKIDSIIEHLINRKNYTLENVDLNWMTFEEKIIYDKKSSYTLSNEYLGDSCLNYFPGG